MKKILFLLTVLLISAVAEARPPENGAPPPPPTGRHPLLIALESKDFTDAERAELKTLAAKDPREFEKAMRKHFFKSRQAKAQKLLALREAWLNAQTEELRKAALEKLKTALREDVEEHLEFQKKLLQDTEENIRNMERRLAAMKQRYEKHSAGKEKYLEKRLNELTAKEAPKRLVREASGDFSRPPRPPKK